MKEDKREQLNRQRSLFDREKVWRGDKVRGPFEEDMQRVLALLCVQKEVKISARTVTRQVIVKTAVGKSTQSAHQHGGTKTGPAVLSPMANTVAGKME